jgi:hypothetical protein
MQFQPTADDYDGTAAFPDRGRPPGTVQARVQVGVTAAFVVVPLAGLGVAVGSTKVRWPTTARLDSRRRGSGQDQQWPALQPVGASTGRPEVPASRRSPLPVGSDRIR